MSINLTSYWTFGDVKWRPILGDKALDAPSARGQAVGDWKHVPYGGNVFIRDGARLHTSWTVNILLLTNDDYVTMTGLEGQTATLTFPRGPVTVTKTAVLRDMSGLQWHPGSASWRGSVTWEWGA